MAAQLHASTALDAIANDIVGATDMVVALEDDPAEWQSFLGPEATEVLGFVMFQPPPSPLYHAILLGPDSYPTWVAWFSSGSPAGNESEFAIAAMTLIHESYHWKLLSTDESAVNACAIRDFGYYVSKNFNVPATLTQTTTQRVPRQVTKQVRVTRSVTVKRRVKVKGRWTTRTKRVRVTTYVPRTTTVYVTTTTQTTVANPLFQTLVADAQSFYNGQPPPYNSGTCPVAVPGVAPTPPPTAGAAYHVNGCWVQYTGDSWTNVNPAAGVTAFTAGDILTRGASSFWGVVALDKPPTAAFSGTTVSLIQPNGAAFSTQPLSEAWSTTYSRWSVTMEWRWEDNTAFFQHPEKTGTGTWIIRWTFPDGEICSSPFTVT